MTIQAIRAMIEARQEKRKNDPRYKELMKLRAQGKLNNRDFDDLMVEYMERGE